MGEKYFELLIPGTAFFVVFWLVALVGIWFNRIDARRSHLLYPAISLVALASLWWLLNVGPYLTGAILLIHVMLWPWALFMYRHGQKFYPIKRTFLFAFAFITAFSVIGAVYFEFAVKGRFF